MGRILAIDYGQKRVGIAATDPLQLIANGLTTVPSGEIFPFLKNYLAKEKVDRFVVGLPRQMNYEPSESMRFIKPFLNGLKKYFPDIPVSMVDERFTSKLAFQTMIDSGIGRMKRRDKALVDQISATIILQSYLEQQR
ncbi:MAG: Holliday junction resolvase RuvX [Prevotellaceae bacterium]|nr:Holliday junction resolvase RuvX [Prevotellaceae bacterium]